MPANVPVTATTVGPWRDFDPGGAWTAVAATFVDDAAIGPGTRTVDLRITAAPTPATGYGVGGQIAADITSLDAYRFTTEPNGAGTEIAATATVTQPRWLVQGPTGDGVTYGPPQLQVNNPTDRPIYLDTASGNLRYIQRDVLEVTVTPPGTTGPTTPPPGSGLPPDVVARIALAKANPGFVCKLTFTQRYDLLGVELGDRINLTIAELGIVTRGHIVTAVVHHFQGSVQEHGPTQFVLESEFTLEKIPGTLLPGAGTSTPDQDAAGGGAEVGMFLRFNDAASGFNVGNFSP